LPPTGNFNTPVACALVIFFMYNYYGFKENGFTYLKHFAGPVIFLAPLMFVIEVISHLVRPVSLSLRLFEYYRRSYGLRRVHGSCALCYPSCL
jgi:F-type H+-transporting ATPase subunit a